MNASEVSAIAWGWKISVIGALLLPLSAARILGQGTPDSAVARSELPPTQLKSGTSATLLSLLLPGLGHVYAEDNRTCAVLIPLFVAGTVLGHTRDGTTAGTIGGVVALGSYWYGLIDAHNAAARYNRAHATKISEFQVRPVIRVGLNSTPAFGIAMQLQR